MKAILSRDSLKATETVVWGCTVDWAKAKLLRYPSLCFPRSRLFFICPMCFSRHEEQSPEAIRKSLGDLLYLVRFPLMSIEMFGQGPGRSCILTQDVSIRSSRVKGIQERTLSRSETYRKWNSRNFLVFSVTWNHSLKLRPRRRGPDPAGF